MKINRKSVVTMHYTLTNENGKLLETTKNDMPIQFMIGINFLLPSLENALIGMSPGEKKKIILPPEKGYGKKVKELTVKISRSELPYGDIKVGNKLWRCSAKGERKPFKVTGFLDNWVFLDGNHPLAGMELHYQVEIISVHNMPQTSL